ncbi:MAG: DNA translocase FtsK, partial [Limnochordia bacterium]
TDELLEDAIRLVVETGQASISMLQRRFRIGYSRAARLIDMMEVRSIVGPYQGSKPREVLVDRESLDI